MKGKGAMSEGMIRLPDGSGCSVASMPLPRDHWLYEDNEMPPMGLRCGTANPLRKELERIIREAARYAVRGATMSGKCNDFDPDALVQNMVVGALGYFTADGLSGDFDPNPAPPQVLALETE